MRKFVRHWTTSWDAPQQVPDVSVKLLLLAVKMLTGREMFFDHFTLPDAYFFLVLLQGGGGCLELIRRVFPTVRHILLA